MEKRHHRKLKAADKTQIHWVGKLKTEFLEPTYKNSVRFSEWGSALSFFVIKAMNCLELNSYFLARVLNWFGCTVG